MARWRSAKAERAHLIAVMRAEGRTWVEIAEAFRDRYSVNAMTALRLAHGWSQDDVAKEWTRRWPDDPRSDKNISSWERWPESGHPPSLDTLIRLAKIYRCDLADLVADRGRYRHLDDVHQPKAPIVIVAADQEQGRTLATVGDVSRIEHASTLQPVAASLNGAASVDVTAIRAMSDAFRAADRRLGGGQLYSSVTRYLNAEVAPHLLTPTAHAPDAHLFAAAASLTEAAGWMAHDGGRDELARLHFARAFRLASVADDGALEANICASMSHLASHIGEPHEAVRLADKGLRHTGPRPLAPHLVARLYAMRALGFAVRHEPRASLRALDQAEKALGTDHGRDRGWTSHFDEGSLAIEMAMCLRRLGDLDEAERQARRALDLRNGDRVRSRTFAQLTLAHVLADATHVDEAATVGTTVCEIASTLASTRVVHQLDGLALALADHSSVAEVADFHAALAELYRSDASATQPPRWPT